MIQVMFFDGNRKSNAPSHTGQPSGHGRDACATKDHPSFGDGYDATRWHDCAAIRGLGGAYIRFCETNPIYFAWKTGANTQGYKVFEIGNVVKKFGFVLENEPNLWGLLWHFGGKQTYFPPLRARFGGQIGLRTYGGKRSACPTILQPAHPEGCDYKSNED